MNTNWDADDQDNIDQYTALCKAHGHSHLSLDWGSVSSQEKRFKILSQIGIKNNDSVLDVGCGLGDFYGWAHDNGLNRIEYKGIDITPALIDAAREKYPKADFQVMNILDTSWTTTAHYVIASGIFAKRKHDALSFATAMITRLYETASKGIAFNSLSTLSTELSEGDTAFDPYEIAEFCRTLSPWVVLRMDYHPHDFTIYIKRDQP